MMSNTNLFSRKQIPAGILTALLIFSGIAKISGHHPMNAHFEQLGFSSYIAVLGCMEIVFGLLFFIPRTASLGLLMLTAYFGGAIAVEVPFHMMFAPLVPLVSVWICAFFTRRFVFKNLTIN